MTSGLDGSIASAPMDKTEKPSVTLYQEAPPSLDFHTPPLVAPAYMIFGFRGLMRKERVRPAKLPDPRLVQA